MQCSVVMLPCRFVQCIMAVLLHRPDYFYPCLSYPARPHSVQEVFMHNIEG